METTTKRIKRGCVGCDKKFSTKTTIKIVGGLMPVREDEFLECKDCRSKLKVGETTK